MSDMIKTNRAKAIFLCEHEFSNPCVNFVPNKKFKDLCAYNCNTFCQSDVAGLQAAYRYRNEVFKPEKIKGE